MTRIVLAFMVQVLVLAFTLQDAHADVLLIDEVRQVEGMELPANGQSKTDTEAQFGAPEQKHSPVGDPPITRWDYATYSVYFEYDRVLFPVLHPGAVIEK